MLKKNKVANRKLKDVWTSNPDVIIGKHGWESVVDEFKRQIKKNKIIKVKLLKSARVRPVKEIAKSLAEKTNSKLIEIRGYQIIYAKR
ncbi:MAG: RNA-binding protein [Promethearchaeota archaeon]|nr:MAG: RNA-binding protein [Candidatus Lokiarchaeota archaeon]